MCTPPGVHPAGMSGRSTTEGSIEHDEFGVAQKAVAVSMNMSLVLPTRQCGGWYR